MKTITVFGLALPEYDTCKQCGKLESCQWSGYFYNQPCKACKATPEYEQAQQAITDEMDRIARVNDSVKGQLPVAVHEFRGQYLYTNHKGDIIKEEKARPMQQGEKWKKK